METQYNRNYWAENREHLNLERRERRKRRRTEASVTFKAAIAGNVNYNTPALFTLGRLVIECPYCKALSFESESRSNCCHNGKLTNLAVVNENFPIKLQQLFLNSDSIGKHFREFIRQYNNANAFASMGAKIEDLSGGIYSFKISGEVYHRSVENAPIDFSLDSNNFRDCNSNSNLISYAELFFYDTDTAVNIRMNNPVNGVCKREIMWIIGNILETISPYAQNYRQLRNVYENEVSNAVSRGQPLKNVTLLFTKHLHDDKRIYNAPTTKDDVALVYVCDRNGNIPSQIDFAVHPANSRSIRRISCFSKHLDPMIFPIFFPNGDFGWSPHMPHNPDFATRVRNTITPLQFYAFKIAIRRNVFNPLHYGGKLFQQYLVHAYARVEAIRLQFIRANQKQLRVESYQGLHDFINTRANNENCRVGNVYILPSSFSGGPRHMAKIYQDNMAIVRKYGRPDLFITFTCNPNWEEISTEIAPFQTSSDRPDLVTRVFNLKLKEFINDVTKKEIFGKIIAYVYTIEHQKRGLPHAHCLFTLASDDKIRSSEDVDNIISAEIPDNCSELRSIILKHNVHGPCGTLNPTCVCMINEKCSKSFPKSFCNSTDISVEGYPKYRRRLPSNTEELPRSRLNIPIDNRFIVPYNPYLSRKYNAHINVELCSTVKAVKYIHKYITKGQDYARIGIRTSGTNAIDHDEIQQFLNCRYISSQEASWRLQEFLTHDQSHTVVSLSVHLKGGQSVFFRENEAENALRQTSASHSMLTAYFHLNRTDPSAHQYFYQDIPMYYVYKNNKWVKRSSASHFSQKTIGRIVSVSPKIVELYHLRLLLLAVKGLEAISFESLKNHNNAVFSSYKEVARARGLINDSTEWHNCLSEASEYMLPQSLRVLFAIILCHCNPSDPSGLLESFKEKLMEDFIHIGLAENIAFSHCAQHIKEICEQFGFDVSSLVPIEYFLTELGLNRDSENDLNLHVDSDLWTQLNEDQLRIASAILLSLRHENTQKCFYIDGPGGSGKTFIYRALIQKCKSLHLKVQCVAWTGIAATLLPNGMTCHAAFSLPLNLDSVKFPHLSRSKTEYLKAIDCLIWDEAPMATGIGLEIVDLIFKDLMRNDLPFGRKVVVLGGDFRQVPPVVQKGNRISIINSTIKKHRLWNCFQVFSLQRNMRALNDVDFAEWLLNVGDGTHNCDLHFKKTQYSLLIPETIISSDIVTDIFGQNFTPNDSLRISQRAILCPKNEDVRVINEIVLNRLQSEEVTFYSIDTVKSDDGTNDDNLQVNFPVEFLNSLNPSGLPPHKLSLKVGSIIILLRNLSLKNGLCNGTRMVVRGFRNNIIQAEIVCGTYANTIHFIPRISLNTENDSALPFNFVRHQFPIRLAFAMTINKSQGQTLERVGIYLPNPCFTHGQFYTAISRTINFDSLKITVVEGPRQGKVLNAIVTDNVVYPEIFS